PGPLHLVQLLQGRTAACGRQRYCIECVMRRWIHRGQRLCGQSREAMSGANPFDSSNGAGQAAVKDEAVSAAAAAPLSAARANAPVRFETLPFVPRLFLSNGHLQTVAGIFLSRTNTLPPPVPELVEVSPASELQIASSVLCECHWHPAGVRAKRMTVVLVHGLEGSSDSQYVVGNANKMWRAGANVIRMNMRNCGD